MKKLDSQDKDTAESLFSDACNKQKTGDFPQAIALFQQLLHHDPSHRQGLRFSGLAYAQQKGMENAILCFSRALVLDPDDATLHNNLANAYKQTNQPEQALKHYQKALLIDPNYASAHHNLAHFYDSQHDYPNALRAYRTALHLQPDAIATHYNLGRLLLRHNELTAAETQFNNVLTLQPNHIDARFYLGLLHLNANRLDEAKDAFEHIIHLQDDHVFSLTNLGVIALKRNQGQLAIDYFTKVLVLDANHLEARNNLAATFMHHDRFENALMHYGVLLDTDPNNQEYLYNSGVAQMALGHLYEAIDLFESILKQTDKHVDSLHNLAAIHMRLGHKETAIDLLKRASHANPKDTASPFLLHALTGDDTQPAPCHEYVTNLFNNYALYYDKHMQHTLNYTLPYAMMRTLHQLDPVHYQATLDLGCGTGLSGCVLREVSTTLTGVDISSKMLAQAKDKGIYDTLIESDLLTCLRLNTSTYDLIVALDVLPYLGDLDPLFDSIRHRLAKNGYFVFSCEISSDKPWFLQDNVRFCHHPEYIKALCDNYELQLLSQETLTARQQNEQDVRVLLCVVTALPSSP